MVSMFHVIYKFNLATNLPLGETLSYAELAQRCGLPEEDVHRVLRLAISHRIFTQPEKGKVAHNAISGALAANPFLRDWVGQYIEENCPASTKLVDALAEHPGSQEASESAVAIVNGRQGDFFTVLERNPDRLTRFANAMTLLSSIGGSNDTEFASKAGWSENCPQTIVDVGGSHGSLSQGLLRKFPSIEKAIVQDRSDVVVGLDVPADLKKRLEFEALDFFAKSPAHGADVYLYRAIFHDWYDQKLPVVRNTWEIF